MPKHDQGMTLETAQLLADLRNVEAGLHNRGDRTSLLLEAALAAYRLRLEDHSGFVRLGPAPPISRLKFIRIRQGHGWLKLIDTRVTKRTK